MSLIFDRGYEMKEIGLGILCYTCNLNLLIMENFNKNWLVILLVAVIFGTLGFLIGRTTGNGGGHQMMRMHGGDMDKVNIEVEVDGEGDGEAIVKTDTIMKDGRQIIVKEVKKIKKN